MKDNSSNTHSWLADSFAANKAAIQEAGEKIHNWMANPDMKNKLIDIANQLGEDFESDKKDVNHPIHYLRLNLSPESETDQLRADYLLMIACYHQYTYQARRQNPLTDNWHVYLINQCNEVLNPHSETKRRIEAALINVRSDLELLESKKTENENDTNQIIIDTSLFGKRTGNHIKILNDLSLSLKSKISNENKKYGSDPIKSLKRALKSQKGDVVKLFHKDGDYIYCDKKVILK